LAMTSTNSMWRSPKEHGRGAQFNRWKLTGRPE
jgi:hypothetical protein